MYIVLTSPKGQSSIAMSRWLGVEQKTAWKVGHAIREMMNQELMPASLFVGAVEFDEKYVGGKPRKRRKQGHDDITSKKVPVMVIAERNGRVAAKATRRFTAEIFYPFASRYVNTTADTYSDEHAIYHKCELRFGSHEAVSHANGEYARGKAHNNTCESFNSLLERMFVGTYHRLTPKYLQRYVDELVFKWNLRSSQTTANWNPGVKSRILPLESLAHLLSFCQKRQTRRSANGAIAFISKEIEFPDCYANQVAFGT
jgi:hypothetical protein